MNDKIKSTVIRLLLTTILITALLFSTAAVTFAGSETNRFDGADCTENEYAAATIDYIMAKYQHKKNFDGPGQCWGYAEKIKDTLADDVKTTTYNGLRFTKAAFTKKCLDVKAGTHIRFSHGSRLNPGSGHSVVLLKVSEKQVIWADNNYCWDNKVAYYKGSMNDFYREYAQYEYINMIARPTSYKMYQSPMLAIEAKTEKAQLSWMKLKKAELYKVYRSYSKDGTFTQIAETEDTSFTDKEAKSGKTVYYKVKAAWEDGSKTSSVQSCKI